MATSAFSTALSYVLVNEGGLADNPLDHGKITNRGITLATLSAWRVAQGKAAATADDVKALTLAETGDIYRALYWNKIAGDSFTASGIVTAIFDAAVLNGPKEAGLMAQTAANAAGQSPALVVDGALGAKSVAALNALSGSAFLLAFVQVALTRYVKIVQADATQRCFLPNWARRAAGYLTLI